MPDGGAVAAIIDGSFEGLMTVVYKRFYDKFDPVEIVRDGAFQQNLLTTYVMIETNPEQAAKVIAALQAKLDEKTQEKVYHAFLHRDDARYLHIYRYVVAAFKIGAGIDRYEHLPYVLAVRDMAYSASHEAHLLKGFVRFRQAGGKGAFYADISPEHDCLPLLAPHFANRFCDERFIIHDTRRHTAVVYNGHEWALTDAPPGFSPPTGEDAFVDMWKAFYDAIGIQERANSKQRRSMMPKRFWQHMDEMKGKQ